MLVADAEVGDVLNLPIEASMPSPISRDDDGLLLITELISGYVDDESFTLQPDMRKSPALSQH